MSGWGSAVGHLETVHSRLQAFVLLLCLIGTHTFRETRPRFRDSGKPGEEKTYNLVAH